MNHNQALRFWPLQLTGWLAFGIAMGLSRVTSYPLDYMLATKSVLALLGLLVSLVLRVLYRRLLRKDRSLVWLIVVLVSASYLAAFPWTAAYNVLDAHIYSITTGRELRGYLLTSGALYHAFVLVSWSVLYLGVRQYTELQEGRERLLRAQALATEGRLSALRYQLNPHFLYNTLNAISTLVLDQRTTDATRMISRLSELLRVTLSDQSPDEVRLSSEIEVLRQYLAIEQVRFGERLSVSISVDASAAALMVPTFILQPVVENAIRHGISLRESGGTVIVRATHTHNELHLTIEDDGVGFPAVLRGEISPGRGGIVDPTTEGAIGIGLRNCRERLRMLYGDRHRMKLDVSELGGARVTLTIPARGSSRSGAA